MEGRDGDATRVWHVLDGLLPLLREARRGLEASGCEVLAESLGEVIDGAEAVHGEAEKEILEDFGGGPGRSS